MDESTEKKRQITSVSHSCPLYSSKIYWIALQFLNKALIFFKIRKRYSSIESKRDKNEKKNSVVWYQNSNPIFLQPGDPAVGFRELLCSGQI